jgi:replication-associated recombination protein RarA
MASLFYKSVQNQFLGQNYFPKDLEGSVYYNPLEKGFERKMKKKDGLLGKIIN